MKPIHYQLFQERAFIPPFDLGVDLSAMSENGRNDYIGMVLIQYPQLSIMLELWNEFVLRDRILLFLSFGRLYDFYDRTEAPNSKEERKEDGNK